MSSNTEVDESFDPAKHELVARKRFDELRIGDRFPIPSRTIGDANFAAFQLASGVLKELKRVTPRNDAGRPTARYPQSLTRNIGYPKLKEHLGAVIAFMKISQTWGDFINLLNEHYPRKGDTPMLPMGYDQESDDGKGL